MRLPEEKMKYLAEAIKVLTLLRYRKKARLFSELFYKVIT